MNGAVWSISENAAVASEMATAAASVANLLKSEAAVVELGEARTSVQGTKKILVRGPGVVFASPEAAAEAIYRAAKQLQPSVFLVGATRNGREIASRLAAKTKAALIGEASRLFVEDGSLVAERSAYAGKAIAKISSKLPCVATIRVGSFPRGEGSSRDVQQVDVGEVRPKVKILGSTRKEAGTVDLKSAKLIVSAGRGVKKKEDLAMLEDLAVRMKGALGCSRPLSSDLGWLPEEHHIGLTGVNVKPDLYIALGISGQLQHVAGMKDSKIVAAVNSDKDAPIFQAADYGVVGDLYQIVPALRKALDARD